MEPGFAADFYLHNFTKRNFLNLAHYFPYDVKLRLLAHSRSFLANQKAINAIVGFENLLNTDSSEMVIEVYQELQDLKSSALNRSSSLPPSAGLSKALI